MKEEQEILFGPILNEYFETPERRKFMKELAQKSTSKAYVLLVRLLRDDKIVRSIEVLPNSTLYSLANDIIDAFDFRFDQSFGFYDSVDPEKKNAYASKRRYELYADLDKEDGIKPECPGTYTTPLKQLWKKEGDTWYFLFDQIEKWIFEITLVEMNPKIRGLMYPRVLKKIGQAPKQYPFDDYCRNCSCC